MKGLMLQSRATVLALFLALFLASCRFGADACDRLFEGRRPLSRRRGRRPRAARRQRLLHRTDSNSSSATAQNTLRARLYCLFVTDVLAGQVTFGSIEEDNTDAGGNQRCSHCG
jgi:hypothetical protein